MLEENSFIDQQLIVGQYLKCVEFDCVYTYSNSSFLIHRILIGLYLVIEQLFVIFDFEIENRTNLRLLKI